MLTKPNHVIKKRKRDARHYFRHLSIGNRWQKFLAHPPGDVRIFGVANIPLHTSVPIVFAQQLVGRKRLPMRQRLAQTFRNAAESHLENQFLRVFRFGDRSLMTSGQSNW
jgi:hypothetical protein